MILDLHIIVSYRSLWFLTVTDEISYYLMSLCGILGVEPLREFDVIYCQVCVNLIYLVVIDNTNDAFFSEMPE